MRGKIACLRVGKAPVKDFRCAKADGIVWLHHVEGVRVAGINVDLRRNARGVQLLEIPHRFCIKRLAFTDESIGGREMSEVAQTRGRGIGGKVRSVCPTQIEIPGKAVPAHTSALERVQKPSP